MAKTISVPIDSLHEIAQTISDFVDKDNDIFDRIGNTLKELSDAGAWQGKAQATLSTVTAANIKKYHTAMKELEELSEFMKNFADEIEEKDLELKSLVDRAKGM